MSTIKGQNLRLFVTDGSSLKCIAAATSCTVHVAANVEDSSTKDSEGNFTENEVTGFSWDMSTDALLMNDASDTTGESGADILTLMLKGQPIVAKWQETTGASGTQNRTAKDGGIGRKGSVIIADYSITAGNRANSTYTVQFTGTGAIETI